MDVCWFEQKESDVPDANDWLNANEANLLYRMRFLKRRADWRLGRWTAKNALAICLDLSTEPLALREIEILATSSGAPEAFLRNQHAPVAFSLSHRAGIAACAVVPRGAVLGCDLEISEPRSDAFAADYFAPEEQALLANEAVANRDALLALLWSGKESALKALRLGLRRDTRSVIVSFPGAVTLRSALQDSSILHASSPDPFLSATSWNQLHVRTTNGESFHGWWSQAAGLLRTLVAAPPPDRLILLSQEYSLAL